MDKRFLKAYTKLHKLFKKMVKKDIVTWDSGLNPLYYYPAIIIRVQHLLFEGLNSGYWHYWFDDDERFWHNIEAELNLFGKKYLNLPDFGTRLIVDFNNKDKIQMAIEALEKFIDYIKQHKKDWNQKIWEGEI